MTKLGSVFIFVLGISLTIACVVLERKFLMSDGGHKYLLKGFDSFYHSRNVGSKFNSDDLASYLKFSYKEFYMPIFITSASFYSLMQDTVEDDEGFCGVPGNYSVVILSIMTTENVSLAFYGCDLKRNIDVKIWIVDDGQLTKPRNELFWIKHSKIHQHDSFKFCECNKTDQLVKNCINGENSVETSTVGLVCLILFAFGFLMYILVCLYKILKRSIC